MTRLSIIIASSGRSTLTRAIQSASTQTREGDEILISLNNDSPWGHAARNQLMVAARGEALMFMDDDDCYVPGALDVVREGFARDPHRLHFFRMRYASGNVLWMTPKLSVGNVSTVMGVVPLGGRFSRWSSRYEGDFDFFKGVADGLGEPVWHEEVIALVRPALVASL